MKSTRRGYEFTMTTRQFDCLVLLLVATGIPQMLHAGTMLLVYGFEGAFLLSELTLIVLGNRVPLLAIYWGGVGLFVLAMAETGVGFGSWPDLSFAWIHFN